MCSHALIHWLVQCWWFISTSKLQHHNPSNRQNHSLPFQNFNNHSTSRTSVLYIYSSNKRSFTNRTPRDVAVRYEMAGEQDTSAYGEAIEELQKARIRLIPENAYYIPEFITQHEEEQLLQKVSLCLNRKLEIM